ncbi:MAG: carboxymuconolactone decarboxylase family protein [Acidobacteriota bacterium]
MNVHSAVRGSGTGALRLGAGVAVISAALVAGLGAQVRSPTGPRLVTVPEGQRTAEQNTVAGQYAALGMPNLAGTYLHYPQLSLLIPHVLYVTGQSGLPPRHRALLGLRTAWLTRSPYLWGHRVPASRAAGLSDDEIARIAGGPDAAGWDPFDAAVLRAADELHIDSFVSDATWQMLSTRYDLNQLVDTVDTVGTLTMHAGMMNSLGIEVESDIKDRLPSVPFSVAATRTNSRLEGRGARIPPQEAAGGRGGAGGNVFRTFNRNPAADRTRGAMNQQVNTTNSLPPRQRELLLMRIGVLCRSEYEYAAHHRAGRRAGLTDADVARILAGPGSSGGDALDTALLRAADELFENDLVSSETWAALAKDLDTRRLFDVLITVGGYRWNSMLINSAGVQLDANMADFRFPPALR